MYVFWRWLSSSAPLPIYKYKLENYFMWSNGINWEQPNSKHSPYYVSFQPFNGLEMWIFWPLSFLLFFYSSALFLMVGRALMAGTLAIPAKENHRNYGEMKKKILARKTITKYDCWFYIFIFLSPNFEVLNDDKCGSDSYTCDGRQIWAKCHTLHYVYVEADDNI